MSAPSLTTGVRNDAGGSVRVELPVSGLRCSTCVQSLESALRAVPGVSRATVNFATGRAFVEYDPQKTDLTAVHEVMKTAGHRVGTATARFAIKGIMCASCVTKIEHALSATPGVLGASVRVGTEEAVVEYLPGVTDLASVKAAVGSAGYSVADAPPPMSALAVRWCCCRRSTSRRSCPRARPCRSSSCRPSPVSTSSPARWACSGGG